VLSYAVPVKSGLSSHTEHHSAVWGTGFADLSKLFGFVNHLTYDIAPWQTWGILPVTLRLSHTPHLKHKAKSANSMLNSPTPWQYQNPRKTWFRKASRRL